MQGLALKYARGAQSVAARSEGVINVAACVVRDATGRILLSRRRADQMSGGFWEVPGGKVEPGESWLNAAARELFEETGLKAEGLRPLVHYRHRFATRSVEIHFFEAEGWSGSPSGREGQKLEWVVPWAPQVAPILASNLRILRLLGLPRWVNCAMPPAGDPAHWARNVAEKAAADGVGAVLFQARSCAPPQQISLARRLGDELRRRKIDLWLDGTPGIAQRTSASVCVFRPNERMTCAEDIVRAVLMDDPTASVDADLFLVPYPRPAEPLAEAVESRVYALADGDSFQDALDAGVVGVCLQESGKR